MQYYGPISVYVKPREGFAFVVKETEIETSAAIGLAQEQFLEDLRPKLSVFLGSCLWGSRIDQCLI